MKKANRIISTLLLFCFVVNTAIQDLAFSQMIDFQTRNSDKLAAPLMSDDIVGIEYKDIGDLEMWFTASLAYIRKNGLDITVDNLKKFHRSEGRSIFNAGGTRFYINEVKDTGDDAIRIMVRRKDKEHGLRTYYIEYSPEKDRIEVYPEREIKKENNRPSAARASRKSTAGERWITPEEATRQLDALPITGNIESLRRYYSDVKEKGLNYEDVLEKLGPELARMTDILGRTRPHDELNALVEHGITIGQLDILRAVSELILQLVEEEKGVDNLTQLHCIKEVFVKYPEISKLLIKYFETKFNPDGELESRSQAAYEIRIDHIWPRIVSIKNDNNRRILDRALGIMMATNKTNYYLENRAALFLRLNARMLLPYDHNGVLEHNPPFAAIWVHVPYGAYGAHSRYKDIARGGLRALNPERTYLLNKVLSECVALSSVQQKKHSDIPEGGAKGVFMGRQGLNQVASAIGYIDGLINTMMSDDRITVTADGQAIDPLELGPDEGTDDIGSIVTVLAKIRGLERWREVMTGNIVALLGTPHKENNLLDPVREGNRVTSQGVMEHVYDMMRWLEEKGRIAGSQIKFSVTGGLDGDVASGIIENAIDHYGDKIKIVSITDLATAAFDPKGFDNKKLLELYDRQALMTEFPKGKLHKGGFVVAVKLGGAEDAYVVLGPETLRYINTKAFEPGLLEKLGAAARFRTLSGLESGQPLVTVLERDGNNRPMRVKAHTAYIRDALFFMAKADALATGGGVRDTINDENWSLFLDWAGNPTTPAIIHGANVFCSKQASINLEKNGVVIEPDFMANSVGVETSSRMEVDFNAIFNIKEITLELMKNYFRRVLSKFLENARRKFWIVRIEAQDYPEESVVAMVAPRIAEEINRLTDAIDGSRLVADRKSDYPENVLDLLRDYFPDLSPIDTAYPSTLDRVFDRMPSSRLKLIASKLIAKEVVFNLGTGFVSQLKKESRKKEIEIIEAYMDVAREMNISTAIADTVNSRNHLSPGEQISRLKDLREKTREGVKEAVMPSEAGDLRRSASGVLTEIMKLVPNEWLDGWVDLKLFEQAVKEAGCEQSIISSDDKSVLIFSEKTTFGEYVDDRYEEGIGILLPSFIKSGIKVAVVASTDKQKALIDKLNEGKPEDQQIICEESVFRVMEKIHNARYYYFKTANEPDVGISGVTNITIIVKRIIDAIGNVVNITESRLIEQMHEAAQKFAIAA